MVDVFITFGSNLQLKCPKKKKPKKQKQKKTTLIIKKEIKRLSSLLRCFKFFFLNLLLYTAIGSNLNAEISHNLLHKISIL